MQNDLISRSKLLEKLEEDKAFLQKGANKDAIFAFRTSHSVIELVKAQPTAYNVEKVVKQLEETRKEITRWDSNKHYIYQDGADWMGEKAIEIVRNGGKE